MNHKLHAKPFYNRSILEGDYFTQATLPVRRTLKRTIEEDSNLPEKSYRPNIGVP